MNLLIRMVRNGKVGSTRQWNITTNVDKATAQEIVNRDFSSFIEGGGKVEIIGQITLLN
jgi:hypothetical protein